MEGFLFAAIVLGVWVGFAIYRERRIMGSYWQRPCAGSQWRRQFPEASKTEIRAFLDIFVEAFGFSRKHRLQFTPLDRVIDVYRTLYPNPGRGDGMELECLGIDLERVYHVNLETCWREDVTLGELFECARRGPAGESRGEPGSST